MALSAAKEAVFGKAPFCDAEAAGEFRTELQRWRLNVSSNGRHSWEYDGNSDQQSFYEKYWLGLPFDSDMPEIPRPDRPLQALERGWEFLRRLQTKAGSWGANCDGPLFVTSGMVFAMYILGFPIEPHAKLEMVRYLVNTANNDGGWGTYLDSPSNVFGTTVNYIILRMLGLPAEHRVCTKARKLISAMGSALAMPSWGKFWLCILGLYEWDGMVPVPPEPLLMPSFLPLSPANWWMPLRNIYISMAYLYGHRFTMRDDALIKEIRKEIYDSPYSEIHWHCQRSNISKNDRLKPRTSVQSATAFILGLVEQWKIPYVRRRALKEALFQIEAEVHNTNYLCLTPVSWASNMLALSHAHGPDSHWVQGMKDRFTDPMWMCREGLAASGTDGTAVWDTSFSVQALCGSGFELRPDNIKILQNALEFLDNSQIRQNALGVHHVYRHPSKGGWPFSTRDQGYFVSDTTAEALTAVLQIQRIKSVPKRISRDRLEQAVDQLLGVESSGGGFAAYEQVRGPDYLERFNITDMYESCMVECRYPECTGSVMMALTEFAAEYPDYRPEDIRKCMERSVLYLRRSQFPEGGWMGSWGVCFSYATGFALQGLACAGWLEQSCPAVSKACAFLLRHQNADGGWGESLESSKAKHYVSEPKGSQIPNTAYVVSGLIAAQCSDHAAIERGVAYIIRTQQPTGDWLPGTLEGIYTPPCGYRYPLYKFHFTLKALGHYVKRYGDKRLID
ncbi:putative Protostadienol synthase A [Lepidopterella palustris CBS 459.81]|uniref:Terpene cyclase/mutase family member n=1 Tax=Lepidopterella palustris CBS 459.81 TaxID=1314670 RepID=A0A8E2DX61_9PEZI|nr:putative Protostadienol synthase A [Lepidopterella palustris CBS 459.81]